MINQTEEEIKKYKNHVNYLKYREARKRASKKYRENHKEKYNEYNKNYQRNIYKKYKENQLKIDKAIELIKKSITESLITGNGDLDINELLQILQGGDSID